MPRFHVTVARATRLDSTRPAGGRDDDDDDDDKKSFIRRSRARGAFTSPRSSSRGKQKRHLLQIIQKRGRRDATELGTGERAGPADMGDGHRRGV